ncbi:MULTISPECIES: site-2 protease family protein [Metallosphaera]|nr:MULTISPECIES: site-2 protease family protein [Metallosphaera]AKV75085.1 S2P metalloprotease [Metallosphaera sedula]AKV77324.1 S2P metalloprotease [Metallosphaera sedula]AKV79574.1 S2P metalloprotease [Metallosphaera sedula]AKV81819.1 S2P metalloprotease [Metallosphaera sedula]AKV84055.1 S2P metalloprotease [Metallosphaera sedula]
MASSVEFFIGLLVFWAIVLGLRNYLSRKGFSVYPFLLLWKKGTRDQWFPGLARSRSFKVFETLSVALAIISMIGGLYLIMSSLSSLFFPAKPSTVKLEPIIPGVTVGIDQAPYILLSIGISVVLHELMHAVSSTSNKVPVKSGGFILLAFFPGAFVEPDETTFLESSLTAKLKIISAGIAINLILAGIFFPLAIYLPPLLSHGIYIEGVIPNSAAYNASLHAGYVIQSVNGIAVSTPSQLKAVLESSTRYTIGLLTPNGTELVNVTSPTHFLGVYISYYYPWYVYPFVAFFLWMFIVNFSLALLNGAPLIITDGGKIFTELLKRIHVSERVSMAIQGFLVLLLVLAISMSFIPQ